MTASDVGQLGWKTSNWQYSPFNVKVIVVKLVIFFYVTDLVVNNVKQLYYFDKIVIIFIN